MNFRIIPLAAMLLASGIGGALVANTVSSNNVMAIAVAPFTQHVTPKLTVVRKGPERPPTAAQIFAALDGKAKPANAASLPVSIIVTSASINQASNNYTESISLASGDTSGLSGWSWTFTGPGTTPRYPINATTTLSLP
jgi:hypothetical protein